VVEPIRVDALDDVKRDLALSSSGIESINYIAAGDTYALACLSAGGKDYIVSWGAQYDPGRGVITSNGLNKAVHVMFPVSLERGSVKGLTAGGSNAMAIIQRNSVTVTYGWGVNGAYGSFSAHQSIHPSIHPSILFYSDQTF